MEQDDVSDSGAEQGHQALNNFVQTEINDFVHGINLLDFIGVPNPQDKINELIDAMKKKIQDGASSVVSDAIKKAQGFWSNLWSFLNADDKIGSAVWTFSQQDIVQHHYAIALDQRWRNEGDWELFGAITAPNPCQAQLVAVNQQKVKIEGVEVQIRAAQTEMARAPATQKAAFRAEIAELQAQLPPLQAELTRLEGLLNRCYMLQSVVAVPVGGGVLTHA
jgi:hypothetical protein